MSIYPQTRLKYNISTQPLAMLGIDGAGGEGGRGGEGRGWGADDFDNTLLLL